MKNKKYLYISLSFLLFIIALSALFILISIYSSHKTNKIAEFSEHVSVKNGLLIGNDKAYLYNEYGSDIWESQLKSIPLSQYNGPEQDFSYYSFDGKYYAADRESAPFSGANSTTRFLYKSSDELYLIDTKEYTCTEVSNGIDFISCSPNGTYFLQQDSSDMYFHKRINAKCEFESPVRLQLESDNLSFQFWINDRYALISSLTSNGLLYLIADAENGEAAPCMSVSHDFEDYQKELISKRYFVTELTEEHILLFNIYTQEEIKIKHKNADEIKILSVSHDADYIVCSKGDELFILSKNGKSLPFKKITDSIPESFEFLQNNILLFTLTKGDKQSTEIHKIMF